MKGDCYDFIKKLAEPCQKYRLAGARVLTDAQRLPLGHWKRPDINSLLTVLTASGLDVCHKSAIP